jgi:nicotinic acid phosphoribosyltransferase
MKVLKMNYDLMYATDFYKVSHKAQYPKGVTKVHSVLVARGANYNDHISKKEMMWFGIKLFINKLEQFSQDFFNLSPAELSIRLEKYKKFLDIRLGGDNDVEHWRALYSYGQLPLSIKSLEEKSIVPFQTPLVTVENTHDAFYWLTSFIETSMLSNVWGACNSANRSWHIRKSLEEAMADHSEEDRQAIDFMAHDFSQRGMMGDEASLLSGCGHLANFKGSDSLPAIRAMEEIYGEVTGFSVPASEHSVMCAGGKDTEEETFLRLLETYPTGIISIVSDTWDYFGTLTKTLPNLKDVIMAREGKTVIRPDSGDPVRIICGDVIEAFNSEDFEFAQLRDLAYETFGDRVHNGIFLERDKPDLDFQYVSFDGVYYKFPTDYEMYDYYEGSFRIDSSSIQITGAGEKCELTPEMKGSLRLLDETFGHSLDSAGLKLLDPHIGLIYGDGMNQERIKQMVNRILQMGYSPLNMVFGIGAYTYQFTTRDELSFAFKATAVEINGEWVDIQKDPKTDPGKKSLTGRQESNLLSSVFYG